jgi:C-terminal processing protease CtpA/Prc
MARGTLLASRRRMNRTMLLLLLEACSSQSKQPPAPEPTDWCKRVVGGAPSSDPAAIGLAIAHVGYRYFGTAPREHVDDPIAAAFGSGAPGDVEAYSTAAIDVCAADASTSTLGPESVELRGDVAWIVPGTGGPLAIPDGARAIAIDLRGLPDDPVLPDALGRVTTAALAAPLDRATLSTTTYSGHPDSWFFAAEGLPATDDIYGTSVGSETRAAWPGAATASLPVAVVTDLAMPAVATELAAELRVANRAAVVGHSIVSKAAETTWYGVGARGLAIRTGELGSPAPLPDTIAADLRTDDPDKALAAPSDIPSTAPLTGDALASTRPAPRALVFYGWPASSSNASPAQIQAGLAVAYGTVRGFWRIYDAWPAAIDTAYATGLAEAAAPLTQRYEVRDIFQRFSASLADSHVFVADLAPTSTSHDNVTSIDVTFDVVAGQPVVASSHTPQLHAGDTVVTVDGTPVGEFLAPRLARIASGTPLHLAAEGAYELTLFESPTRTFGLRAADGSTRTEVVSGTGSSPAFGPQRASGFLTDLGAPDVYYMNINGSAPNGYTADDLLAQLDTARTGAGLVIDDRGYPGVDVTELLARLIGKSAPTPMYGVPTFSDTATSKLVVTQYTQRGPTGAAYTLPVTVLVGPYTQSFAENIMLILEARPDLNIIGRQTSGSDGNITSVAMPSGFGMAFTGMQVHHPDGRAFHGIGIVANHPSSPSVADFAAGIDRELTDAIAILHTHAAR